MRQLFRDAFDDLGGVPWLVAFARADYQNARIFVSCLAKLIPLELTGKDGAALTILVQRAGEKPVEVNLEPPPFEHEVLPLQ